MSSSIDGDGATQQSPVLATIVVILLTYYFILHPAFFSPLAKLPNAHWSAPYSRLWILNKRYNKRENRALLAAHQRLGPVIRVAPYELSIDDVDCVRTVYSGGFDKSSWYSVFDNYGVPCMFSTRPAKEHSIRKRWISHVYSKSYIQSSSAAESQAHTILFDRVLPIIQASTASPHGLDVHSLFLATTMDFISSYVFGISTATNLVQDEPYRRHWLELYKSRNDHGFYDQELPWLTAICRRLGIPFCPRHVDYANAELEEWCRVMERRTREQLLRDEANKKDYPAGYPTVMAALLAGITRESAYGTASPLYRTAVLPGERAVASELLDHLLAGQETAGVALTYLTWRLSRDPTLQAALREELLTSLTPNLKLTSAGGEEPSVPDAKALNALPLLHAVLTETLRLHAPIPGPQPRVTPSPTGCSLAGYRVPAGVRVAALAHTLHRRENVFPRPEEWDHTRWMPRRAGAAAAAATEEGEEEEEEDQARERKRAFWAFSSGGRMCVGSNFAMHEMKLVAAAIYSNYATRVVSDAGLAEQTDGYTGRPAEESLYLRFERVE